MAGYAPINDDELAAFHSSLNQASSPQSGGNFLTHMLPTIGGTGGGVLGGALGGAAAGTAILPGIGTAAGGLIGALLGGAAGGAGGKVLENHVEHQALGNGVAGQALENGVLSAGPLRLLKGAAAGGKALLGAGEAARAAGGAVADTAGNAGASTLVDAINAAGNAAAKPGLIKSALSTSKQTATDRSAAGFGTGVGQKVNGDVITPDKSAALQDFIHNIAPNYGGIKPGMPIQQAADAQAVHNNIIDALSSKLNDINRGVTPEETAGIAAAMRNAATDNPALSGSNLGPLSSLASKVSSATDLKGLEEARMLADKLAYPNGTDLASSQLAQQGSHARDAIDAFVSKVPDGANAEHAQAINDYKAIKGHYGLSKDVLNLTSAANDSAKGIHVPLLGGSVGEQSVTGARNKLNGILAGNAGGDATTSAAQEGLNAVGGAKGIAGRDLGVGGLASAITGAQGAMQNNANPIGTDTGTSDPSSLTDAINGVQQSQTDSTNDPSNPFSQNNIEMAIANDIQQSGGKNINTLLSLYNTFGKPDAAAQALTTNQKNEVVSQNRALGSLNAYVNQLQASGPTNPILGALNGSVIGQATNPAAYAVNKQRIDVASAIAGSLNPRGTVSPVTARIIAESLPSIHDTPAVQKQQIANLVAQIKSGAYSGDTPVSQLVANGQAAQ